MFSTMYPISVVALSILYVVISRPYASSDSYPPEQIHLAIGWTPDRMAFTWTTFDYPIVTWTRVKIDTVPTFDSPSFQEIRGKEYLFQDPWDRSEINRTMHVTYIPDLEASTRYYYQVGDQLYGFSDTYSFRTGVNAVTLNDHLPINYVIFGDLGVYDLSDAVELITNDIQNDPDGIDTVIHVGDMAYDMYQEDGTVGDEFMNMVQPISANVPYMVCPGNHEKYENFSHYSQRYRGQPTKTGTVWTGSGETPNNWYYSWNEGLVHWIAISTEIYFNFPWMVSEQYEWLIQDLIEANNNRTEAPWIIVYGHKQIYCSDPYNNRPGASAETLRDGLDTGNGREYGLEDVFYEYGVDFYFAGHQHNYERIYDVYKHITTQTTVNMPATTYLLVGAAGAKHGLNDFESFNHAWSAVKLLSYGYAKFNVYNSTHIEFKFIVADAMVNEKLKLKDNVYETVWYVQENHGPFKNHPKNKENHQINQQKRDSVLALNNSNGVIDLRAQFGMEYPRTVFEPDVFIPYISSNKADYQGVDGVNF